MMSVKPALGWLALLLFATTAQAEGARDFLKVGPANRFPTDVSAFERGTTLESQMAQVGRENAPTRIREAVVAADR